jgi:hypothetical protein
MAYSKFDFSNLTFSTEEVRRLRDLFMTDYVLAGDFADHHLIVPGVEYDKEIGFVGELGTIGIAAQGCSPNRSANYNLPIIKKTWQPKTWEALIQMCETDMEGTLALYSAKKGPERFDITDTDVMEMYVEKVGEAIQKMLWRLAWLGDTAAANVGGSPAGVITAGISTTFFTLMDGFWKQAVAIVATTPARLTAIAANAQATYALQNSVLTAQLAYEYLEQMAYDASPALKARLYSKNYLAYCTRSIWEKAIHYYIGQGIQPMFENMQNGVKALNIGGILWQPIDIWDEQIRAFQDTTAKWNKPHRAVLTTPDNLAVGFPSVGPIERLKIFYDNLTRTTNIEALDKMAPLVLQDNLTQWAY